MFPGRSPGSRNIDQKKKLIQRLTHAFPSYRQWLYVNRLPGYSGATAADSHRFPFRSQTSKEISDTEEPHIFN